MAVITMLSNNYLIDHLVADYPQLRFISGQTARWAPSEQTVYYSDIESMEGRVALLHEVGHALCDHRSYHQDIELIALELEAWQKATALASHFGHTIENDWVHEAMDSYRGWLHDRSRCPTCSWSGFPVSPASPCCTG